MKTAADDPVLSIVLLSLLRWDETLRCINSIFNCTRLSFEIIVVNMGVSEEIITQLKRLSAEHERVIVIYNTKNVGTTTGRNQGIAIARGKYIVFLDNDTEVTAGWAEPLIAQAELSPDIAACGSKVISPNGKVMNCAEFVKARFDHGLLQEIGVEFTRDFERNDPEINHVKNVPWYPTTCLLVKKSALEIIEGFDEHLFLCEEDKDLCLRMTSAGMKILYVPESTVYHHHKTTSDDYSKIRNRMPVLMKDVKYFEKKWNCRVFIRHSRTYLHKSGMDDPAIDRIKKFSFFNTILEEKLALTELILTVTNRCNHACGMCYYHKSLKEHSKELTPDEYQKISASLNNLNILWITGGEPFLRTDLADVCRIFVKNNHVKNIFIPSNGSQPERIAETTQSILLENPGIKLTIMLSLEGTEALHDQIHGKPGAFRAVEETIKKLNFLRVRLFSRKIHFSILLNSVVTSQNIHQIIPLMEYAKTRLMIDSHSLSPMRGSGRDPAHQPPSGKSFNALYKNALPYFSYYAERSKLPPEKIQHFHDWMHRRYNLWCNILDGGRLPFACQAGNLIGVLEPDGGIRICESKPLVANVRDFNYNFTKAWFSLMADQSRAGIKDCACTHACFLNVSEEAMLSKKD